VDTIIRAYTILLNADVPKEKAREILPMATMTEFYWCVNLRCLFNFIMLRDSKHAQEETREFAKAVKSLTTQIFPTSMIAFEDEYLEELK